MNRNCQRCGATYDDADRTTICPHALIMPAADPMTDRDTAMEAARRIVGGHARSLHSMDGYFEAEDAIRVARALLAEAPQARALAIEEAATLIKDSAAAFGMMGEDVTRNILLETARAVSALASPPGEKQETR